MLFLHRSQVLHLELVGVCIHCKFGFSRPDLMEIKVIALKKVGEKKSLSSMKSAIFKIAIFSLSL